MSVQIATITNHKSLRKYIINFLLTEAFLLNMFGGKPYFIFPLSMIALLFSFIFTDSDNTQKIHSLPFIVTLFNIGLSAFGILRSIIAYFDNDDYSLKSTLTNLQSAKPLFLVSVIVFVFICAVGTYGFLVVFECQILKLSSKDPIEIVSQCGESKKLCMKDFLILAIASIISLLLFSKSSPLYPLNDWGDANCFLTVGKAILAGKVPYLDIYEQKGPVLYFLHALTALISANSFLGIWLVETLSAFLFGTISLLTVRLFCNVKYDASIIGILELFIYTEHCFGHGDSAEELCLPILAYILYLCCKFRLDLLIKNYEFILLGLLTSITFWIKYSLLGLLAGAFFALLIYSIRRKKTIYFLKGMGWAILSFILFSIPVLIYFIYNKAFSALSEAYFYNNIFLYQNNESGFLNFIETVIINFVYTFCKNPFLLLLLAFAAIEVLFSLKQMKYFFLTLFAFVSLPAFVGKVQFYYSFPLNVFLPILVIHINQYMPKTYVNNRLSKIVATLFCPFVLMFCVFSSNTYLLCENIENRPQYILGSLIATDADMSLLDLSHLDNGFYLLTNQVPAQKYFCKLNLKLPQATEEWEDVINNGKVNYITTRDETLSSDNYALIKTADYYFESKNRTFYLYKRVNDTNK